MVTRLTVYRPLELPRIRTRLVYERKLVRRTLPWDENAIFGESPKTVILEISVKVLKELSSESPKSVTLAVFLVC